MITRIICAIKGHKYRCRNHNPIQFIHSVDTINVCVVRCTRCFKNLEFYLHYEDNCGKQYNE